MRSLVLAAALLLGVAAQSVVSAAQSGNVHKAAFGNEASGMEAVASTKPQARSRRSSRNSTQSAPQDYTRLAGLGFYKVHPLKARWEAARRRCAAEGAHLLILNSAVEAAAAAAASGFRDWSWLGFDDFSAEGEFVTLHGRKASAARRRARAWEE